MFIGHSISQFAFVRLWRPEIREISLTICCQLELLTELDEKGTKRSISFEFYCFYETLICLDFFKKIQDHSQECIRKVLR